KSKKTISKEETKTTKTNDTSKKTEKTKEKIKVTSYKVKKGESLTAIARKFEGVTVKDLMEWNDIDKNDNITPGQLLKIKTKK
ncbi:MAG: LysM peptidoglycan-binding domain-containing protein, partial [Bacteroidales bacterium]